MNLTIARVYYTGVISLAQYLDYEKVKDYLLTIQATDRGFPPLSNQAAVNITVLDFNDNVPTFSQLSYSARVSEDIAIGDIVTKVKNWNPLQPCNGLLVQQLLRV